jgi:AcrR family transcriptional regulator
VAHAALKLLVERGYGQTTIEAIATEAGVGLRTVYDIYGSKSGILAGLLESFAQIPRPDFESRVEALTENPAGQLQLTVDFVASYFAAAEPFLDLLRTTAHADPALLAVETHGEALRRVSQRAMVRNWAQRGALAPGLNAASATDILWAMTSPSIYRMLVQQRRWSRRRYRQWLFGALRDLLLGSGATGRP